MRKAFVASFLSMSIIASTGCAQLGVSKEQAGTVLGGLAGAVVGSQIGDGKGRVLATILMAGAGAYIGNKIGSMLDERDREALAQQTQQALMQADAGAQQPMTWTSQHSGATAKIEQGQAYEQKKPVEVKRVATVQAVPSMKLIQAPYVTMKSSNVRAAPSMDGAKVGGLQPGTEFTAVGSTGDWILVGRQNVTVGYVHKSLVAPKQEAVAKQVSPTVNLDTLNVAASPETQGFDLDNLSVASNEVAATSTCRPVNISLTAGNGQTESESSTYCKNSSTGTWELI